MAHISHRTTLYNMTANPVLLQEPTRFGFTLPCYSLSQEIHTTYREYLTALDAMRAIFCRSRPWFKRESVRAPMHFAITKLLANPEQAKYLTDWREMVLEYPHTADKDEAKVAYTENEAKGIADRQTITTLGKFIKRHAPAMPDHVLRDIVALTGVRVALVFDLDAMVHAVQEGPKSCMQDDFDIHPYRVYRPEYGWHMAVRTEDGVIQGRCLCLEHEGDKLFVRSYKRPANMGHYSESDEGINAWLRERGYIHTSGWPCGAKLARIEDDHGGFVMPYIDGCEQSCTDERSHFSLGGGEYSCDHTNGRAHDGGAICEDCGDRYNADNAGGTVGYHGETYVCDSCLSDNYTYAYGRRGDQYHVHNDNTVECSDGDYYDEDYLSDNDIVYSEHDNQHHPKDECIELDCDGRVEVWVHEDDIGDDHFVCLDEDTGAHGYRSDCWQHADTEVWYSSNPQSEYYEDESQMDLPNITTTTTTN